jgi:hypothetical protein
LQPQLKHVILHQNLQETFNAKGGERASMRYADPQIEEDGEGWRWRELGRRNWRKKCSGRVANDGRLIIMSE